MRFNTLIAAVLKSRGIEGALLALAVGAWFKALDGAFLKYGSDPVGTMRLWSEFFWSISFWFGVAATVLARVAVLGRQWNSASTQWLGNGSWVETIPNLADPPGLYVSWNEASPRHPLESSRDDAAFETIVAGVTGCFIGLCAGYIAWQGHRVQLGLTVASPLACAIGAMIYTWNTYGPKSKHLVWVKTFRQAYLTPSASGDGLDFIVVSKISQKATRGVVLIRMPWSEVNIFDSGSYWRSFGLSLPPDRDDWNIIKMTPRVGEPVIITETFAGESRLYDLISSLTAKFGPTARTAFERTKANATSRPSAAVSPLQISAAYWANVAPQPMQHGKVRVAAFKVTHRYEVPELSSVTPQVERSGGPLGNVIPKPSFVDSLLRKVPEIDRRMPYLRIQLMWPHPCLGGVERVASAFVEMYPPGVPDVVYGKHAGDAIAITIHAQRESRHWTKQLSQLTTFAVHKASHMPVPAAFLYSDDTEIGEETQLFSLEFADGEMIPIAHVRRGDPQTIAMFVAWSKLLETARVDALQATPSRSSNDVPARFD